MTPRTVSEIKERLRSEEDNIRALRDKEFELIDRSQLWYDSLTPEQYNELQVWYNAWLDAPDTKVIPERPTWLK